MGRLYIKVMIGETTVSWWKILLPTVDSAVADQGVFNDHGQWCVARIVYCNRHWFNSHVYNIHIYNRSVFRPYVSLEYISKKPIKMSLTSLFEPRRTGNILRGPMSHCSSSHGLTIGLICGVDHTKQWNN